MTELAALYRQLASLRPLEANEEGDALYVDWQKELAPADVKGLLANSIALSAQVPVVRLFTGHRGTGKTRSPPSTQTSSRSSGPIRVFRRAGQPSVPSAAPARRASASTGSIRRRSRSASNGASSGRRDYPARVEAKLPSACIAAAVAGVANHFGNGPFTVWPLSHHNDPFMPGDRTCNGGAYTFQIPGPLPVQDNVAIPMKVQDAASILCIYAYLQQGTTDGQSAYLVKISQGGGATWEDLEYVGIAQSIPTTRPSKPSSPWTTPPASASARPSGPRRGSTRATT